MTSPQELLAVVRDLQRGIRDAVVAAGRAQSSTGRASAAPAVARVAAHYAEETGQSPQVFSGSSPGAA